MNENITETPSKIGRKRLSSAGRQRNSDATPRREFKTRWVLLVTLIAVGLLGMTRGEEPATVPARGVLPVICFPGPPAEDNVSAHWQKIKEANFTIVLPSHQYTDSDQQKMLDYCAKLGLKAIVNVKKLAPPNAAGGATPGWREEVQRATALFRGHPALFGYMIRDEPGADLFPQLDRVADAFREDDPQHVICVNLFPNHATDEQLGTASYAEYLQQFMTTVNPPFLCYDHYPLLLDGRDRPDFFLNLELARIASQKHGKPLWTILLSSWWQYFRTPSAGELRWQVYGALAYGVKGFGYFTYWPVRGDYDAVVDYQGNETPLYNVIREVNSEALAMGSTLLLLKSTAVFHTGATIPEGCTRLPADVSVQLPGKQPLIAGFFEDAHGVTYIMIVNRNYRESMNVEASFSPQIDSVSMVSKRSGQLEQVELTGRHASLDLPPGGGTLLRLAEQSLSGR